MCSHLFIFSQWLPTISFSSSSPHLFIFFITLLLFFFFFSLQKPPFPLFSSYLLILSFSQLPYSLIFSLNSLHLLQWHPRPRSPSTSFPLNAFHLTRWSGVVRLMGSPPLTYRPKNHISMAESVSFSTFLIFQVSL